MSKTKKVLVTILSLAMVFTMLTACAAPAQEPADASAEEPAEVTEEEPVEEAAEEPAAEEPAEEAAEEPAEEEPAEEVAEEPAEEAAEDNGAFNYTPVENTDGEEIKIATLSVQNNPFWVEVGDGIKAATEFLAGPEYNCTVDSITFDDFDGQEFSEAIDTCVVKGYDAICTVGVADTIVPSIDAAVEAGIPVFTFNSETSKESERTAFVGQDLYAAGVLNGETLAELMGGEGKVGIITGYYNVNAHELRRQGIEEGLGKFEGIEVVGSVENHDSGDEAYTAAKDFITANPDLKGIAVTAGGPHGAAKAIEELELQDQVMLVCFDTTDEMLEYIRRDVIKATIGQDPFGQGADPIILAYNQVVTGEAEVTGDAFTKMDIYTPENINEFFPE